MNKKKKFGEPITTTAVLAFIILQITGAAVSFFTTNWLKKLFNKNKNN